MTKIVEFEARSSIESQARDWMVRIDGDEGLTPAEHEALQEWLARSPLHREELKKYSKFWQQADILTELAVPLQRKAHERAMRAWRWPLLSAALATLASVTFALWWFRSPVAPVTVVYSTPVGKVERVSLADGSTIQLNTNSEVQVAYDHHLRRIDLRRGEALFEVTRDAQRPFEVFAAHGVVRAIGTAFAVRLKGSELDVSVTEGVVELARVDAGEAGSGAAPASRALARLKAGQTTTLREGAALPDIEDTGEREMRRRLSWHEGYLTFADQPLSEVVEQVNRYSPVTLTLADPQLSSVKVGARFRIGDLDAVLDVLQTQLELTATRIDDRTIRLESAGRH